MAERTASNSDVTSHSHLWWLKSFIHHLFFGDQEWGWARLFLTLVLVIGLAVSMLFFQWNYLDPFLGTQPPPTETTLWAIIWKASRYLIAPVAAIFLSLYISSRYVQDIYELPSLLLGFRFVLASLYGVEYPKLVIEDGKKLIDPGKTNLIDVIGGPGFIIIRPGNVVLLERLKGPSNVLSSGTHFISRFERVKDIANLQEQQTHVEEISAVTKDGIEVTVRNVNFRYRLLRDRRQANADTRQPYPFSIQGVRNMAYGRRVMKDGLMPWHQAVKMAVTMGIVDYISKCQYDHLTAPVEGDPRQEIISEIRSRDTRRRLRDIGVELIWVDIGHFDNALAEQMRFEAWKTRWQGSAELSQAEGEAQRLAYQEMGRAEAQAEMLMSIMHAFEDTLQTGDSAQQNGDRSARMRNIFLARTAQMLDSLVSPPPTSSGAKGVQPPSSKDSDERRQKLP